MLSIQAKTCVPFERSQLCLQIVEVTLIITFACAAITQPNTINICLPIVIYVVSIMRKLLFEESSQFSLQKTIRACLFLDLYEAIKVNQNSTKNLIIQDRIDYLLFIMLGINFYYLFHAQKLGNKKEKGEYLDSDIFTEFDSNFSELNFFFIALIDTYNSFLFVGFIKSYSVREFGESQVIRPSTNFQRMLHLIAAFSNALVFGLFFRIVKEPFDDNSIEKQDDSEFKEVLVYFAVFIAVLFGYSYIVKKKHSQVNKILKNEFKNEIFNLVVLFQVLIITISICSTINFSQIYRHSHPEYYSLLNHYTIIPIQLKQLVKFYPVLSFFTDYFFNRHKNTPLLSIHWMAYVSIIAIIISLGFTIVTFKNIILKLIFQRWHSIDIKEIAPKKEFQYQSDCNKGKKQQQQLNEEKKKQEQFENLIGDEELKKINGNPVLEIVRFRLKDARLITRNEEIKRNLFEVLACQMAVKCLQRSSVHYSRKLLVYNSPSTGLILYLNKATEQVLFEFLDTYPIYWVRPELKVTLYVETFIHYYKQQAFNRALLKRIPIVQIEIGSNQTGRIAANQMVLFFQKELRKFNSCYLSSLVLLKQLNKYISNNPKQVLYDLHEVDSQK